MFNPNPNTFGPSPLIDYLFQMTLTNKHAFRKVARLMDRFWAIRKGGIPDFRSEEQRGREARLYAARALQNTKLPANIERELYNVIRYSPEVQVKH